MAGAVLGGIGVVICLLAVAYFWFAGFLPRLGAGALRRSTAKRFVMCAVGFAATLYGALDSRSVGSWIAVGLAALIVLTWAAAGETVRATVDGAPIHVQRHWWLSWSEFYPDTTLWEPPRASRKRIVEALRAGGGTWHRRAARLG